MKTLAGVMTSLHLKSKPYIHRVCSTGVSAPTFSKSTMIFIPFRTECWSILHKYVTVGEVLYSRSSQSCLCGIDRVLETTFETIVFDVETDTGEVALLYLAKLFHHKLMPD